MKHKKLARLTSSDGDLRLAAWVRGSLLGW